MNRLSFVLIALGQLTANKVTLELPEQKGLLEILEDVHIEQQEKANGRLANSNP